MYELHVKDFSSDPHSGISDKHRGKFLAFTEEGTTLNGDKNKKASFLISISLD